MTSPNRERAPNRLSASAPPLRSASALPPERTPCMAGASPTSRPLPNAMSAVNVSTVRSMRASSMRACSAGKNDGSASAVQRANSNPSPPPAMPRSRLSVNICRMSRRRVAPSASRTATSRRRAVARERSSPATLAHAISRTSATAESRTPPSIATSLRNDGCIRRCGSTVIALGRSGCPSVPRLLSG